MTQQQRVPLFSSFAFSSPEKGNKKKPQTQQPKQTAAEKGIQMDPLDAVQLCNCCECGVVLFANVKSEVKSRWISPQVQKEYGLDFQKTEIVRGRIHGRPYCNGCLTPRSLGTGGGSYPYKGETSPGWENAVRAMEG